jgi:hypothetical protein
LWLAKMDLDWRVGVNLLKNGRGCRDVPKVSSMSDLAIVDAFPCRVRRISSAT